MPVPDAWLTLTSRLGMAVATNSRRDRGGPAASYLLAGQQSEEQRLRPQSEVWEPAGQRLLDRLGGGDGRRALDVGCGCLGWLRLLARWTGGGQVTGADTDPRMLELAAQFTAAEQLTGVELVRDDLFDSRLPAASFDLVHARFQITPLGRP